MFRFEILWRKRHTRAVLGKEKIGKPVDNHLPKPSPPFSPVIAFLRIIVKETI